MSYVQHAEKLLQKIPKRPLEGITGLKGMNIMGKIRKAILPVAGFGTGSPNNEGSTQGDASGG